MMKTKRLFSVLGLLALCAFLFAACGNSTSTGSSGGTTPAATSSDTSGYGGRYGDTTPTPTTSASTSSSAVVKTASATVNGKSVTILTDAKGMTLYYFTPDTSTTTACTGGCATNWPPLVVTGSNAPTGDASLPGKLTTLTDANGNQVEYNGHLLYTFAADTAPGDTKGEGVGNKWYVATTDLS